ncbi:MAG TPA: hypothetical protein DCZ05_10060 [Deltaproteobacteria bacterium]|nr:hypothetical protein [Deltaproteobacteria bacterium]
MVRQEKDLPIPLAQRLSVSSAGMPFGGPLRAPKAMGFCFFRTVRFRCLRLAQQAPSLSCAILEFRRLGADLRSGTDGFFLSGS